MTGSEIKKRRIDLNMSAKQLAKAVGITATWLSLIENDKVTAEGKRLKIEKYFNTLSIPTQS